MNGVGFALHEAEHVGFAGLDGKIIHFIIQKEAELGGGHAAAVASVQGVGHGDNIAIGIDDCVMGGLGTLGVAGLTGMDFQAGSGAMGVDRRANRGDVLGIEEAGDWNGSEFGIAQKLAAIGEVMTHGFGAFGLGWVLYSVVSLVAFVLWILLMVKAYQGEKFHVPVAGDIAQNLASK